MRIPLFCLTLCLLISSTGCSTYRAPVMPPVGLAFSSISAPLDTDAEGNPAAMKSGESSSSAILVLIAFGDSSIDAAVQDGNLETIHYLDYSYLNVLGVFQKFTTRAYGE